MNDEYRIAREVTDEVIGEGAYADTNRGSHHPAVQAQVTQSDLERKRAKEVGALHEEKIGASPARADELRAAMSESDVRSARKRLDDEERGALPFIVGVNANPPVRLRRFATEAEASEFISTLEGHRDGHYYIDDMTQAEDE